MTVPRKNTLLGLPLEIRYLIYEQLYGVEPVSYPFGRLPVSSVSQGGPPRAFILTCRQLFEELREHYFSLVTFRFISLGARRISPKGITPGNLVAIRQARKLDFLLIWNVVNDEARSPLISWPYWMRGWLDQMVWLVKKESQMLKTVIISIRDATEGTKWFHKRDLLEPFQLLKGKARFAVGEIIVNEDVEDDIMDHLKQYVKELNECAPV
jgi:hypothetical protein